MHAALLFCNVHEISIWKNLGSATLTVVAVHKSENRFGLHKSENNLINLKWLPVLKPMTYPAFDFLDFLPGSCQDLARSWKIIQEIQDSYQEIQVSRKPTGKSRNNFPDFVGNFSMQFEIFQEFSGFSRIIKDLSGFLFKVLNLHFPQFCRDFQDAVPDFPGIIKIFKDPSRLLLKALNF